MTKASTSALDIAKGYYEAWSTGDVETAMTFIADDIVCEAPNGDVRGLNAYREFTAAFAGQLTGSTLLAAFGDDTTALLSYQTELPFAKIPAADTVTVTDGKISHILTIFDRLPMVQAQQGDQS